MNEVLRLRQQGGIAIVALEEREFKNTFTPRFIEGLTTTFEAIGRSPDIRVVVVHGFDNYFCAGGTKDELRRLFEGEGQFTDLGFYDVLLRCEVPVIAAMQGHAIGGGLAFGCFADIIILGEECLYGAVFMKYGFTPGLGATYIIPRKLGLLLGTEMLMTARNYYGGELRQRGVQATVVKKKDVIPTALEIAAELADKPLLSLKLLKANQNRQILAELPAAIEREVAMHRLTFHQPEVAERIETRF